MSNVIEAQDLKKSFAVRAKGGTTKVQAVRGVTLSVKRGEILGFLGPNGAGKTTTLRMLTTLLPIDEGRAVICGCDLVLESKEVRRRIGYVSQLGGADPQATGRENLVLQGRLHGLGRKEAAARAQELIGAFALDGVADRFVRTYSGGQKRRLEIAMGMVHRPEVLFLDEPTLGLDPQSRANLWDEIRKLRKEGTTVFLTTHYLEEADVLCDRIAIIDSGVIAVEGSPAALKSQVAGDVVQVRLSRESAEEAAKLLAATQIVRETRVDDDRVHLLVSDGAQALPEIFEVLRGRGLQPRAVTTRSASLDEVFLKYTGRSLREVKEDVA